MKTIFPKAVLLGLIIAVSIVACSSGDNGEDPPPPPVYHYYAYVANYNSHDVTAFNINATTGALTAVAGSPFATGEGPAYLAVDPSGKFAYIANYWSSTVFAFTINAATGALTTVAGSPFAVGGFATSIAFDKSGKFAYVAAAGNVLDAPGIVSGFAINPATGALTPLAGSPFAAGDLPSSVAVDPRASSPTLRILSLTMFLPLPSTRPRAH